ncbi:hypothetical protein JCGZ_26482 [Jatropha curcas]|uniref:Hemerythrin-like domain-containing protein n=1 Tax=Jatropha curcas TaxID=180498 RepID=A0A067L4P4_JATCU|nr:uncharacterized protein LOC105628875 [Jatropha curcas]KDP43382.1 hypothetical protein JCGZ_26482 [Jatropha curcas]
MGNCLKQSKKSTAEIAPYDFIKSTAATAVKLYGSPTSAFTSYIRFALLYKTLSLDFIPTSGMPLILQIGADYISGTRDTVLQFIDAQFPQPPLLMKECDGFGKTTLLILAAVVLQHRSVIWHLERMVRWGEDLAARGGRKNVDPAMGTPRMEIRKFSKSYSQLLEFMVEHAQMEERVVFPILEMADRGLCKAANEEHARALPIMNGIKEDIKTIGVLDTGSPDYQDALCNLSTRLKSLLEHSKKHFEEEERVILPLMEAVELSKEQQMRTLEQCFDLMQGTHSHLFNFLLEGLLPWEAMHYLDLIISCKDEERAASMLQRIIE